MTQTADTLLTDRTLARPVGLAALAFSVIYFVSDLIELAQGGFSPLQLALTYAGEAAIPLFVLGLYAVQRPAIGRLGLAGAVTYSYTFVFFTGTVLYAIVERTPDWDALVVRLGSWLDVHSVLMVVAGIAFGVAGAGGSPPAPASLPTSAIGQGDLPAMGCSRCCTGRARRRRPRLPPVTVYRITP